MLKILPVSPSLTRVPRQRSLDSEVFKLRIWRGRRYSTHITASCFHTSHRCLERSISKSVHLIYTAFVLKATMQYPVSDLAQLALAIRSLNGNSILVLIPVQRVVNGEQTWSYIGDFLKRVSTTHHRGTWIETLFAKDVVGTADIHQVSPFFKTPLVPSSRSLPRTSPCLALITVNHQITPCDPILSVPCFRVSLREYKHDTLFTQALERPALLSRQADYLSHHEGFTVVSTIPRDLYGQNVIVINRELDKLKVIWLLSPLLVVSPGLGLVIGLRSHSAEVGLAVSAVIFTLVSCFQSVVAWLNN